MKSIIESYVGIWVIMVFTVLSTAFLSIHLNVIQARRISSDIKTEVQATNGSKVPENGEFAYNSSEDNISIADGSLYEFNYTVKRCTNADIESEGETYIYNDIYKIKMNYTYVVPLFGTQVYPMTLYTY